MTAPFACFVINLDRSPDRLERISQALSSLGQTFTRIRAHDAKTYTAEQIAEHYDGAYSLAGGSYLTNTWVCITLSHVDALKAFLASGEEYGLILEDDACLGKEALEIAEHLCQEHQKGGLAFDMAELMGPHSKRAQDTIRLVGTRGGYVIGRAAKTTPVAACMLYTRTGAQKVLKHALPLRTHWDNYLSLSWLHGAKAVTVRPFPVWHEDDNVSVTSDHTLPEPTRKDRLRRKLFRLYQGPRRFLFNLGWLGPAAVFKLPGSFEKAPRRWRPPLK